MDAERERFEKWFAGASVTGWPDERLQRTAAWLAWQAAVARGEEGRAEPVAWQARSAKGEHCRPRLTRQEAQDDADLFNKSPHTVHPLTVVPLYASRPPATAADVESVAQVAQAAVLAYLTAGGEEEGYDAAAKAIARWRLARTASRSSNALFAHAECAEAWDRFDSTRRTGLHDEATERMKAVLDKHGYVDGSAKDFVTALRRRALEESNA